MRAAYTAFENKAYEGRNAHLHRSNGGRGFPANNHARDRAPRGVHRQPRPPSLCPPSASRRSASAPMDRAGPELSKVCEHRPLREMPANGDFFEDCDSVRPEDGVCGQASARARSEHGRAGGFGISRAIRSPCDRGCAVHGIHMARREGRKRARQRRHGRRQRWW
jgi:hypothetical protein